MNLSQQARQLIRDQKQEWPLAKNNYAGLEKVKTKKLAFDGFDMTVQFNPERIVSSSAKIDPKSIEARPCFLCQQNLPKEQWGIPVMEKYTILVNPFPIFSEHLTIPGIDHTGQLINSNIGDMLDLARLLEDFTVFYNGPKCGASAPDHLHFQAGIKGHIQLDGDYKKGSFSHDMKAKNGVAVSHWHGYARTILTLSGNDKKQLVATFHRIYSGLQHEQPDEKEPMLNILAAYENGEWTVHIFPRKLHRPWQYFEQGEKQILLSPGAADMAGLLITPREEDFKKITSMDLESIFKQVCLEETVMDRIIKRII